MKQFRNIAGGGGESHDGKYLFIAFIALLISLFPAAYHAGAQTENEIRYYIDKVEDGGAEEVKQVMPQLMTQYQNTPELFYLQGRLETNGLEAVKLYRSVIENYPKNQYADAALYRIYQYYYATGLYQSADAEMQRLKRDYPSSPYLTTSNEVTLPREDREVAPAVPREGNKTVRISANSSGHTDDVDGPSDGTETGKTADISQQHAAKLKAGSASGPGNFSLQVGAFSTAVNAEKQKSFFEKKGYHVEVSNRVMEKKGLYLVWVGAFRTANEAKREAAEIKSKFKIASMVVER